MSRSTGDGMVPFRFLCDVMFYLSPNTHSETQRRWYSCSKNSLSTKWKVSNVCHECLCIFLSVFDYQLLCYLGHTIRVPSHNSRGTATCTRPACPLWGLSSPPHLSPWWVPMQAVYYCHFFKFLQDLICMPWSIQLGNYPKYVSQIFVNKKKQKRIHTIHYLCAVIFMLYY